MMILASFFKSSIVEPSLKYGIILFASSNPLIMFLYRDAYYNIESDEKDTIETIIAKNRNGKVGTAKFKWRADVQKIV